MDQPIRSSTSRVTFRRLDAVGRSSNRISHDARLGLTMPKPTKPKRRQRLPIVIPPNRTTPEQLAKALLQLVEKPLTY